MIYFRTHFFPVLLLLSSLLLGCKGTEYPKVTIATSANMQFAMKSITKSFTEYTGIACEVIVGSSGKLAAQIQEGAPYDLLVSADTKYPEILHQSGWTIQAPEVYAYGKLVLWTLNDMLPPGTETLTDMQVRHIAIANPKTAPYGEASVAALKYLSLYEAIQHKLVYGESIAQTNQFIVSGAADIGITSKAIVLSPQMKELGHWIEIPQNSYDLIAQAAVMIKKEVINKHTLTFYKFLFMEDSQEILENFGYLVPEK